MEADVALDASKSSVFERPVWRLGHSWGDGKSRQVPTTGARACLIGRFFSRAKKRFFPSIMAKARRGGRPPHQPDNKLRMVVELLAGAAVPQSEICGVLKIDPKTLRRHYRCELDRGAARVQAKLVMNLCRLARGENAVALKAIMFSLRCRFGWSPYAPPSRSTHVARL